MSEIPQGFGKVRISQNRLQEDPIRIENVLYYQTIAFKVIENIVFVCYQMNRGN